MRYRLLLCVALAAAAQGQYVATVEVRLHSYGRQEQLTELPDRQYAELRRIRYRYTSTIKVPKGKFRIVLGVLDANSKLSSLSTVSVSAP